MTIRRWKRRRRREGGVENREGGGGGNKIEELGPSQEGRDGKKELNRTRTDESGELAEWSFE